MKQTLDALDFRLACAFELVVTPDMRKKTPRYARWTTHPDPKFNQLRSDLLAILADFYRLSDGIDDGKGSAESLKELPQLKQRMEKTVPAIHQWLDGHPEREKIDNPC